MLLAFALNSFSQSNHYYKDLIKYKKWGIIAGPVLYIPAEAILLEGNYTFDNKIMWGFNAGVEYDFAPEKRWSLVSGLYLSYEPACHISVKINQEDMPTDYPSDYKDDFKAYAFYSFSLPVLARLNIQVGENTYASIHGGIRMLYFPRGEYEMTLQVSDQGLDPIDVFNLKVSSQENILQGSFIIGTGLSVALNKMLLKSKIMYVIYFQDVMSGDYRYYNLKSSPPSYGLYQMSGNYFGLMFSISQVKRKEKYRIPVSGD